MALKIQKKTSVGCLHYTNTISLKAFSVSNSYFYILTGRTKLPTAMHTIIVGEGRTWEKPIHIWILASLSKQLMFSNSLPPSGGQAPVPKQDSTAHVCLIRHKA
jgi:hypothetical protein